MAVGQSEAQNRLTYQLKKDKDMAANDFLSYDKIRWPCFKDMVLR